MQDNTSHINNLTNQFDTMALNYIKQTRLATLISFIIGVIIGVLIQAFVIWPFAPAWFFYTNLGVSIPLTMISFAVHIYRFREPESYFICLKEIKRFLGL